MANATTLINDPAALLAALRASPAAMDAVGELRTITAAHEVLDAAGITERSWDDLTALSRAIGDLYDPASLPPGPTPGVSLDELADASKSMVAAMVGADYSGTPVDPAVSRRYNEVWAG